MHDVIKTAVETLQSLASDDTNEPGIRLSAARSLLEYSPAILNGEGDSRS